MQFGHVFAVAGNALVDQFVVGVDRVQQLDAAGLQRVHGGRQVVRAQRDVLDAFAVVLVQVLLDLTGLLVAFLVDGDANLAAGAGHGLALDSRDLAFDVEIAHLAEVEQPLVELGPFAHAAAVHVVREVVDIGQDVPRRVEAGAGQGLEIDVEEADIADLAFLGAALAAPLVHQVDQAVADALDGRDIQLARPGAAGVAPGAERQCTFVGRAHVLHTERDGADARPVQPCEALREAVGLGIDDEIDAALAVQQHVFVAVAGDRREAHALEQRAHRGWVRRGIFDEFEAVGTHRVVPGGELHGGASLRQTKAPTVERAARNVSPTLGVWWVTCAPMLEVRSHGQ